MAEISFPVEKYINNFPAKKHDHFLIPAGTIHCSGSNTVVLEVSATPYIFTFKLWDWDRLGLDGRLRPVHIEHGSHVIQYNWFTKPVLHDTEGRVNVLNLVEGRECIVESPTDAFEPFIVHYAETFIVPADVGKYMIRPYGESEGKEIATLKVYVREI